MRNTYYLCLDNDPAGDDATTEMQDALDGAQDIRERFAPFNDVNDYLLAIPQEE